MSSQKLFAAVFFVAVSEYFLLMAAEGSIITGEKINCLSVKSKYRPFEGQNTVWKNPFQKAFTDQEIEITQCEKEGEECFGGIFSYGSGVKAICKTQTIDMTIDMYRIDLGRKISQNVNNVPVGCGCHFVNDMPF